MRWCGMYVTSLLFLATAPSPAAASAPPPPPPYVADAGTVLTDAASKDAAAISRFFADDVNVSRNGDRLASGKAAWLRWWAEDRAHYFGRTLGYSAGWKGEGALLVVDQFDTQDNAATPPPRGDPRPSTRATLYRFGADGLIHAVEISEVDSFFTRAK